MRIIGGKYRGKKLFSPESDNIRPTSDRAREALFNILRSKSGGNFSEMKLLDIFCGSGAFALEAISQGFSEVCMVDIDTKAATKNAKLFENEKANIKIVKADAKNFILGAEKYDVLFMDAPYNKGLTEPALVCASAYLQNNALCLIELHKNEQIKLPTNFQLIDERKYGLAKVIIARFITE